MRKKNALYLLLLLSGVLTVVAFFQIQKNLDAILKERLTEIINKTINNQWQITTGKLKTHLLTGSIEISEITLTSLHASGKCSAKADKIELSGISWSTWLKTGKISYNHVSIIKPIVSFKEPVEKKNKPGSNGLLTVRKLFKKITPKVHINSLTIKDGAINYTASVQGNKQFNSVKHINLTLQNIFFETTTETLRIDGWQLSANDLVIKPCNNSYIKIHSLSGNSLTKKIEAQKIRIKKLKMNHSILNAEIERISSSNIEKMTSNISDPKLEVESITVSNGLTEIEEVPFSLSQTFTINSGSITINKLNLENIRISYLNNRERKKYKGTVNATIKDIKKQPAETFRKGSVDLSLTEFEIDDSGRDKLQATKIVISEQKKTLEINHLQYKQHQTAHQIGVNLSLPLLTSKNIDLEKIPSGQLSAEEVVFKNPDASFSIISGHTTQNTSLNQLIYTFIRHYFKSSFVKTVKINNGNLKVIYRSGEESIDQRFSNIKLTVNKFGFNFPNFSLLNAKHLKGTIKKYRIASTAGNFIIQAENIRTNHKGELAGKNIFITQNKRGSSNQPYYFTNKIDEFRTEGLSLNSILNENAVKTDKLIIKGMDLHINWEEEKSHLSDDHPPLLRDFFLQVPFPVSVKKLQMQKSIIHFKDFPKGDYSPASLVFSEVNLSISNLSNTPSDIENSIIYAHGKIQENVSFKTEMEIPFMAPSFSIKYKGEIEGFEGDLFNDWLSFWDLGVRKGQVDRILFNYKISEGMAKGEMLMSYRDLRLNLFKKKTGKKNKITSFLSRLFIHKNNKKRKWNNPSKVWITTPVPDKYSFFYALWHPIKEGMFETVVTDWYFPLDQ